MLAGGVRGGGGSTGVPGVAAGGGGGGGVARPQGGTAPSPAMCGVYWWVFEIIMGLEFFRRRTIRRKKKET